MVALYALWFKTYSRSFYKDGSQISNYIDQNIQFLMEEVNTLTSYFTIFMNWWKIVWGYNQILIK